MSGAPLAWLCEFAEEDGSTRSQFVTQDPAGLRWNDAGGPSPYRTTPLCAAVPVQPAAAEPAPSLIDRAKTLHLNTGMSWREAERLTLSESGIDDAAIDELVGECTGLGLESLLTTEDDLREFARAVLVHGSVLLAGAAPAEPVAAAPSGPPGGARCPAPAARAGPVTGAAA